MIRHFIAIAAAAAVLSACSTGGGNSAEVRARKAANAAIWKTRQPLAHGGRPYEIAVSSDKSFAFIAPAASGFSYTPLDLEAAAKAATGCQATYGAGILALLGGYSETADLRPIQGKVTDFKYWRTDLAC
ncbi:hypothetical protein [Leisingera thetidis]|uniref:hypothetical protein n=1 Tax=Leisingera thetidis TaxID=2930199 RepID=UPI0021F6D199|nr:hypothetical protein [Leisingera thetidis]